VEKDPETGELSPLVTDAVADMLLEQSNDTYSVSTNGLETAYVMPDVLQLLDLPDTIYSMKAWPPEILGCFEDRDTPLRRTLEGDIYSFSLLCLHVGQTYHQVLV
jgi:hypothetical protein